MIVLEPYRPSDQYPALEYLVSLDAAEFTIGLTYHERQDRWYLDLSDADGVLLIGGKMLSPNVPLLADYQIDGLPPGELVLLDTGGTGEPCGYADLGWRHMLVYVPESELPAAATDPYDVEIAVVP